ncbi:MAG TPA: sigma-70 family RNA polymerase sigma factor [Anaerolineales bacterium]|nr:sigma-70 family RNA polymerase sigma factor [Anaerolineales bacterium]
MTISDTELIQRAQKGDSKAIGDLYLAHHEQTYRYICAKVFDPALAEDLTGEVFVRMVTRLSTYRDTGAPFQVWLYRIARNLVVDHFRKTKRAFSVPLEHEGVQEATALVRSQMEENPASLVESQFTLEHLQQALAEMNTEQAEVIRLRFMVGLPIKDVAERLQKTVAAVKALQHRGVLALRVILQ